MSSFPAVASNASSVYGTVPTICCDAPMPTWSICSTPRTGVPVYEYDEDEEARREGFWRVAEEIAEEDEEDEADPIFRNRSAFLCSMCWASVGEVVTGALMAAETGQIMMKPRMTLAIFRITLLEKELSQSKSRKPNNEWSFFGYVQCLELERMAPRFRRYSKTFG